MTTGAPRRLFPVAAAALILLVFYLARAGGHGTIPDAAPAASNPALPADRPTPASSPAHPEVPTPVADAFRSRRSGIEVETGGRLVRLLADDREGSPHERFLVRVDGGTTVLVAHNLDLAPRVPLVVGDSIELRGEYEWNAKGGVIHWTHRDPSGRHQAGWIRSGGRLYQ